ncbi:MAG: hypothetical protein ABIP48_03505 [Planctomycetota bacterium]
MMSRWVFEELRGAAVRRDPNESELFKTEQTGEGEYAGNDALVREILQNSIDARQGDGPVKVRLAVHEPVDAPSGKRLSHYFQRLREPLAAKQIHLDESGKPCLPCRFLVCEDFGTSGLEGDVVQFRDPAPGDDSQQFFWFWRNIGRSGKTGEDLGRWGLGKTVYRAASRVGCMLGLTVRESDRRRFLMGQAVLQIHARDDKEFMPEGYFCGEQDETGLPLPIEDLTRLNRFCKEWHLTRKDEPGLSVVAPFVSEDLKAERLVQAVAVHFFTRILRGDLVVEIVGNAIGQVTLDRSSIADACNRIKWDGPKRTKRHIAPPIAFANSCFGSPPETETVVLGLRKIPELTEDSFAVDDLHRLRRLYSSGELTSVRVNLWLPQLKGKGREGQLDVHLQQLGAGTRCDSYYVREGMTITKLNSRAALRGVQSLVVVDKGPLAELLGDTEGPAHEDWDTSAERPDRVWKTWKGRVKLVRRIVDALAEVLTLPTTEPDFDLLSDFFSIKLVEGEQRQRKPGEESDSPAGIEPIAASAKWFHIVPRTGGFTVSHNAAVPAPPEPSLRIAVAYDLPRGDPLRNWSPFDFTIADRNGGLRPRGQGVKVRSPQGNVMLLTITQERFQFTLDGFDRHRDLFVRVDDTSGSEEAAE